MATNSQIQKLADRYLRRVGMAASVRTAAASDGKKTGDSTKSVGLFIPLPRDLAATWPDGRGDHDKTVPHVTLLYVGTVAGREDEFVAICQEVFDREVRRPVTATLDALDYLGVDVRVAAMTVRFDLDMARVRWLLRERLLEAGFEVKDGFPTVYRPHVSMAYLDGPEAQYEGPLPKGSWTFDHVEIWGMPTVHKLTFGKRGKTAAPLMQLPDGKINYRVKSDSNGIMITVFAGRAKIGAMNAFVVNYPERKECGNDVWKLLKAYPQVEDTSRPRWVAGDGEERTNTRALGVHKAFIFDESKKGLGIGKAMYQAMMAEWFDKVGPFLFMPMACSGGSGTSQAARRVWASLARTYPSSGDVIAVLRRPQLPAQMKRGNLRGRWSSR